ncbi:MAG: EAL domain-containing protein [Pseudomonadota bacterium]
MKPLSSARLKTWLPLFFSISFLLIICMILALELVQGLNHYHEHAQHKMEQLSIQNALPIRRALENQQPKDIQVIIGSLSLQDELDAIVLTDEKRQILFSNRYAWRGKPLQQIIPESRQIEASQVKKFQLLDTPTGLLSIQPIEYSLSSNGLRKTKQVRLWIYLNTQRGRSAIIRQSVNNALWGLLFGSFILAGMGWVLYRQIGIPLIQLTAFSHRLAGGDYHARLSVNGNGEVAQLVDGLHQMAANVNQAIEELKSSEQRLSITLDSIGDAVMVTDTLGLVIRLNVEASKLTGWSQEEAQGRPVIEIFRIINAETREPAEHPVGRVLREGQVVGLANHTTLISKSGQEYQIADSAAPIQGEGGETLGVIMVFQDVTERYLMQSELSDTLNRLQALTNSLPDPCFVLSDQGVYLDILGGPEELLAKNREQLLGRKLTEILPPESANPIMETLQKTLTTGQPQRLEYSLQVPAGKIHFEGNTTKLNREDGAAVIWQARDITRRKRAEEDINRLAKYDTLTGLPNRRQLEHRLEQALARCQRNDNHGALLFIDLDHFKNVNDSLGHLHGDQLLIRIADRFRKLIRTEDIAARFGGDEFVLLLEDLGQDLVVASQHAESVAVKLRDACATPIDLTGHRVEVELSIGIVLFPDDANSEELIKRADIAMYRAKETGRNRACFFSKELQHIAEERLDIQRALRHALQEDELRLFVQPQVNVQGQWIGGEVLVRWQHPERGLIQPNAFIPIAEECGLISSLDSWVFSHAINKLAKQNAILPESFSRLSLNLTEPLMMRNGFIEELKSWLSQAVLEPRQLEFEITERVLVGDHAQAAAVIDDLRDLGIRFSVDDFGTGCSSLRYLQRLPLDALKIDKSFVDRLPGHTGDASIVETIIDMAGHLSLEVIAEGVETKLQLDFLIARGCKQFQGYLFARPMPWDEFFEKITKNAP